jgi:histidinol-phosphate aminotransferase
MPLPPLSPAVAGLTAYRVPRHPAPLELLLDGIGGLPSPPDAFAALSDADAEALVRGYPDDGALRARLAERHGVSEDRVLVTAGADDALDRACRAFLAPGRSLVLPWPSFEMIPRYARWAGAEVREVPWSAAEWPLDAVCAAADPTTTVVACVSPNNPTGAVVTETQLRALREALPGVLVLVDLAYVEFADADPTAAALELGNAVVFRTLSKAWGLAGLRVGYALGPPEAIAAMKAAGNPYPVSGPSLRLAEARLFDGAARVAAYVRDVRSARARLTGVLRELGLDASDSQANFVFARCGTPERALWLRDGLAGLGIGVRAWPGHALLGDAVRISVPADPAEVARLEAGLRAVLAPEALLWDADGVLVDVSASYRAAILATAHAFGADVTAADVAAAKAVGDANNDWVLTQRLCARRGVEVPLAEVTARFEALYQGTPDAPGLKHTERARIDDATLARIASPPGRPPLRMAMVTGRPRRDCDELLAREGWTARFEATVVMGECAPKPDPAPVRLALARLGVRSAWMLGDTVDDVRAARAAGVVPLGVVAPGEDVAEATERLLRAGAARVLVRPEDVGGLG